MTKRTGLKVALGTLAAGAVGTAGYLGLRHLRQGRPAQPRPKPRPGPEAPSPEPPSWGTWQDAIDGDVFLPHTFDIDVDAVLVSRAKTTPLELTIYPGVGTAEKTKTAKLDKSGPSLFEELRSGA